MIVGMSLEIDELLNEAIMTGVPAIIVEGIDDISIYTSIGQKAPFDVEVYAIENITGYNEGCEQLIGALESLYQLPDSQHQIKNNILGIIDKDVRDYRNEIPAVDSILTLKYYSIESHFVSKDILGKSVNLCTKATEDMLSQGDIQLIMNKLERRLLKLYYFSLEALKASLETEYSSDFSYSYLSGRLKDSQVKASLDAKQNDLDQLAETLGLSPCLSTLLLIAKGKWLLDAFVESIVDEFSTLPLQCKNEHISMCQFCSQQVYGKCLYQLKKGVNKNLVKLFSMTCVDGEEFFYILQRIESIKTR